NSVYVINLKGTKRGVSRKKSQEEGGNVFDIMTGVAITILVKDQSKEHDLYYYDIGDNLSKEEKLEYLANNSLNTITWEEIKPNSRYDWINQRGDEYYNYPTFYEKSKSNKIFNEKTSGL